LIKRIFHPIGQGAFYSERHDTFNIVYDCGNWRNTKLADKVVRQAFNKNEVIDILFISHFDYDHVNKIKILKEHTTIKKVVMPLLHDQQKHLLLNIYRVLNCNILSLIRDPKKFFGDGTEIITVFPLENKKTLNDENIKVQDIDSLTTSKIRSGSILSNKTRDYEWIYIPYNYEYKEKNSKLETLLKVDGFDVKELKRNPKYTLGFNKEECKKIKIIYSSLSGNINKNSMLLYSGPSLHDLPFEMECQQIESGIPLVL
jgi:hypothetical protein